MSLEEQQNSPSGQTSVIIRENERYLQSPYHRASFVFRYGLFPFCHDLISDFLFDEAFACDVAWTRRRFLPFLPPFTSRRFCSPADADCFEFVIHDTSIERTFGGQRVYPEKDIPPRLRSRYRTHQDCAYSIRFLHRRAESREISVVWGKFSSHESAQGDPQTLPPIPFDFGVRIGDELDRIHKELHQRMMAFAKAVPKARPFFN